MKEKFIETTFLKRVAIVIFLSISWDMICTLIEWIIFKIRENNLYGGIHEKNSR